MGHLRDRADRGHAGLAGLHHAGDHGGGHGAEAGEEDTELAGGRSDVASSHACNSKHNHCNCADSSVRLNNSARPSEPLRATARLFRCRPRVTDVGRRRRCGRRHTVRAQPGPGRTREASRRRAVRTRRPAPGADRGGGGRPRPRPRRACPDQGPGALGATPPGGRRRNGAGRNDRRGSHDPLRRRPRRVPRGEARSGPAAAGQPVG